MENKDQANINKIFIRDFLIRFRKLIHYLKQGNKKIRERNDNGIIYFECGNTRMCIYNEHAEGVQLIFNRALLSKHLPVAHDYSLSQPPDWQFIIVNVVDVLDKIKPGLIAADSVNPQAL